MRDRISLGGRSRNLDSRYSREDVINCYIDADNDGDFQRIRRTPGFGSPLVTLGNGPIRATHVANDVLYVVSGSEFYRVSVNILGTVVATLKGSVAGATGPARISSIGTDQPQVLALTDERGFLYKNSDDSFVEITDLDFTPDFSVTAFNQRFWLNKPDSNEFFASEILDGESYDPLFFASAENNPDPLRYGVALSTEIYWFGSRTIERWQDTGTTTGFPLRRITGGTIERGLGAQASVVRWEDSIFFLADDFSVRRVGGGSYEKISDLALDQDIRNFSFPERAQGFFIDNPHHKVYCLTFPNDGVTWCYDVSTGFWHKRESLITQKGWRIIDAQLIFSKVILADRVNGNLYTLDADIFSENSVLTPMIWRTAGIRDETASMTISRLEIFPEVGVGLIDNVNASGVLESDTLDPKVKLKISKDGGQTYTSKKDRSLGRIGEYETKVVWRAIGRLKRGQNLVFEFSINDDVKSDIYAGYIDVELGVPATGVPSA